MARKAYCTGCGETFEKFHLLFRHRRLHRCGGRFLPPEARALWDATRPRAPRLRTAAEKREDFTIERSIIEDNRWLKRVRNKQRIDMRARQLDAKRASLAQRQAWLD